CVATFCTVGRLYQRCSLNAPCSCPSCPGSPAACSSSGWPSSAGTRPDRAAASTTAGPVPDDSTSWVRNSSYPPPLTTTRRALATAAASAGVLSYECGSAEGSSISDSTLTRSPPTASTMLP